VIPPQPVSTVSAVCPRDTPDPLESHSLVTVGFSPLDVRQVVARSWEAVDVPAEFGPAARPEMEPGNHVPGANRRVTLGGAP
jgi:hypothetical protein